MSWAVAIMLCALVSMLLAGAWVLHEAAKR